MNYTEIGTMVGKLVQEKNDAYGDSFNQSGRVLRVLYPNGISPDQMDDAMAVIRILDKLFRIAHDGDAFGESPFADISGYGLLGMKRKMDQ